MHNTSTENKQLHNKTISWNDNWILIFICFVGRLLLSSSSSSSFISASFLIQMLKMDKRLFKNWVLCIHHRLRDILWGESLIFSCSHFLFSYYESSLFFFPESVESNHFLLAHIPCMNESHDPGRPFKVAITTSAFSTSSSTATSCFLIWETLVKYDCMVSVFWIFTFFSYFLKFIFQYMLFP